MKVYSFLLITSGVQIIRGHTHTRPSVNFNFCVLVAQRPIHSNDLFKMRGEALPRNRLNANEKRLPVRLMQIKETSSRKRLIQFSPFSSFLCLKRRTKLERNYWLVSSRDTHTHTHALLRND